MMNPFDSRAWKSLKEQLIVGFPILLAITGIALIISGYFLASPGTGWSTVLFTIGTTTLSGGIFSAVASARLFSQIYSGLLHDIVFGKEFLATRNDLDQVWARVSDALCERRFPELTDQIDGEILQNYMRKTRDFYYEEIVRNYTILKFNREKNVLICKDSSMLVLKPHSGVQSITYHYKFRPSVGGALSSFELKVNGKRMTELNLGEDVLNEDWNFGDGSDRKLVLPARDCTIHRVRTSEVPLFPEPYNVVRYKTYVKSLRVHAKSDVNDFVVKFASTGGDLFTPIDVDAENAGRVSMESSRLLMPGQGHILLLVRRPEAHKPPADGDEK